MPSARPRRLRALTAAAAMFLPLLVLVVAQGASTPAGANDGPSITVSKTTDLVVGDVLTVTGSGFDPNAAPGTRPPLPALPGGVYVAFGYFGDPWQPSQNAPSSQREVLDAIWVVRPTEQPIIAGAGRTATWGPDGTFSVTVTVSESADTSAIATGRYGVYVYPGSGAKFADHELEERTSFVGETPPTPSPTTSPSVSPTASPSTSPTASPTTSPTASPTGSPTTSPTSSPPASPTASPTTSPTGSPAITVSKTTDLAVGDVLTITGSGFDPDAAPGTRPPLAGQPGGAYVAFGYFGDPWRPSQGVPSSQREILDAIWVLNPEQAAAVAGSGRTATWGPDGTFEVTLTVGEPADTSAIPTGQYGVYVYPGSGATFAAHELEQLTSFAVQPPAPVQLHGGSLQWGVRESFRSYVTGGFAHGTISPFAGARTAPDGTYLFDLSNGQMEPSTPVVEATFAGGVGFLAHDGALDLKLSNPQVIIDADTGTLVLDALTRPFQGPTAPPADPVLLDDVVFADLDIASAVTTVTDDTLTLTGVPAILTEAGAQAFGGFYDAGAELDPLTITLTTVKVVSAASTITPSVATTFGGNVTLLGQTQPNLPVQLLLRARGMAQEVPYATTTSGASGAFSFTVYGVRDDVVYVAQVGQTRSPIGLAYVMPTLDGEPIRRPEAGSDVVLSGSGIPGTDVTLRLHRAGAAPRDYRIMIPVPVGADGQWSKTIRPGTDYALFVQGVNTRRSEVAVLRVTGYPTIAGPRARDVTRGEQTTISGLGIPGTVVMLNMHRAGTPATDFSEFRIARVNPDGTWSITLRPGTSYTFYASGRDRERSATYAINVIRR